MKKQISNLFTKATTQPPTSVADRLLIGCSSVADRLLTMTSLCHHLVHRTLSLRTLRVAASLTLLLCLGVGQMWGADTQLFTKNFNSMTSASYTSSTNRVSTDGIYYWVKSGKSIVITNGTGVIFNQNASTGTSFHGLVIPVSGVTTAVTITMTVPYSGKSSWKYAIYKNQAVTTGPGALQTSGKDVSGTVTITCDTLSGGNYTIYIGRAGSNYTTINNITITTPASSCTTNATVTAGSNSSVTTTSARVTCSSGISSLGSAGCSISSYGFVIGTSSNPAIGGSGVTKHQVGTTYTTTGTSFYKDLTGLTPGQTYYVRPYATNGNGTGYGTQTSFTTLPTAPTFSPTSGTTVSGSQSITITGHSGSTVYYAWATSAQSAADIYNSGSGSHGEADAGTASTTVQSGKTLYAISRLGSNNSAVSSATYTVDATAPTLSSSVPDDGAEDVNPSGNIVLTFSENVTIVDASKFSLTGGTLSTGSASVSGAVVTIPYSGLEGDNDYTFSIAAGAVRDAVGNLNAATSFDFTAGETCSAPSAPTITSSESQTAFTYGESISLSADCSTGEKASTTYAWYKGSTWDAAYAAGAIQSADIAENYGDMYLKTAALSDAGTYWCEASNGTGCEAHNTTGFTISVAKADMPSTGLATGTATSITSTGATLPFTMTSTSGVGSLTIKVYDDNDDVVKTVTNITPATSASQAVTGLSAGTTYYYTITPIGDANHNDGSETSASSTFTTETVAYSVTYAANGGSGSVPTDANSYSPNAEVTVLGKNTLSKSGYTFCGWSYNGYVYVEGDKFNITEDATLTAVWNQNATTVTLTHFATSQSSSSKGVPDDNSKYLYGYKGSMIDANAVTLTTSNTNTKGQNSGVEIRVANSATLRIYADNTTNATPATFTNVTCVAFDAKLYNSGNQSRTQPYTVKVGGTSVGTGSVTGLASDGYQAKTTGTFAAKNGHVEIVLDNTGSSNTNLYVDNIAITYSASTYKKVTFNKGSGPSTVSGLPADRYVPSGSKIARPATDPSASGYIFDGWVTTSGGTSPFDFSAAITTDKSVYASWVAKTAPTQYTLSGDSYYCPSGTATLTLSGSQSGISYQLLKGGVAEGDPVDGTGDALEWEVDAAGTYTVKAVENATYSERAMSGSVTVSAAATTAISSGPTTSVSAATGVNFTLGSDMVTAGHGLEYQWYSYTTAGGAGEDDVDGATSATYTTSKSAGTYYYKVKVSGDCGDPVYSNMITVTVKNTPTVYTVSGTTSICSGETATITLSGSQSGLNYQLYKGGVAEGDPVDGTGDALEWEVSAAGTYTVKTVETSTYAEATMSSSAVITVNAVTAFTTNLPTSTKYINANASYTYTIAASGTSLSYQWYTCNSDGTGKVAMSDKTTASMTYTFTNSDAPTKYVCCVVTGTCGTITSNVQPVNITPTYYLTINLNGGSGGGISSGNRPAGNFIIANSSTIPTKSGYVFLGWKFSTNNVIYQPGATVTMPSAAATLTAQWETACASITDAAKNGSWSNVASGGSITSDVLDGTITGATLKNSGSGTLSANDTRGLVLNNNSTLQLTIALTDGMFQAGTVIEIGGISNNTNSTAYGFLVSNMATSPATYTTTDAAYQNFKVRYVVTEDDGIEGTSSFTVKQANSNQVYFKSLTIGGCQSCTTISPTLTYSATTLYAFGGTPGTAAPTLNKDGNTGAVTWSSSNTSVVTVDASGNITAVGAGSATITAELTYDGVRCGGTASCDITVPALVTQTINVGSSTAWGTTPALTFTPSDKGMEQVLRLTKNTFTFDSTSTSTKQDGTSKRWMTASFTGSETTKGKYLKMAFKNTQHNLRLGEVVVPIQPISNDGSAQVEIYEGSTLRMTSTAVTGITKGSLADVHFTFASPYVFAAGSTINVYIYFYGQTTGFRLASPILISGAVLTDYTYTTSGNWSTAANWNWGKLPMAGDNVVLQKPVTVDNTYAVAKNVVIDKSGGNTGKLTIAADGMLIAGGTIRANGDAQTAVEDVVINTTKTSQGALIFDNPSGSKQTKGTVNFYTRSYRDNTSKKLQWQYVGIPFDDVTDEVYGGLYVNKYSETAGSWTVMRYQGDRSISAWDGLALAGDEEGYACLQGTFTSTADKAITLTHSAAAGENLIGNSWTAPIQIADLAESDFDGATATIYLFNTGRYKESEGSGSSTDVGTKEHTAGQWMTIPINSAASGVWAGMKVIPAFNAFEVITSSEATLSLDYSKVVASATNDVNAEMRAPVRRTSAKDIDGYRIRVADELTYTDMYLFEDITFTTGHDNGWDGDYMPCDGRSAQLYAQTALGKLAVAALPNLEGTVLGFKPGQSSEYTFSFGTNAGVYYLNDIKTQTSTLIQEGNTYTFNWEDGDSTNRFIISATPYKMPTGVDEVQGDKVQSDKVRKVLIDDHLYIIRAGEIFNATGSRVK